jgi:hypothetical protein
MTDTYRAVIDSRPGHVEPAGATGLGLDRHVPSDAETEINASPHASAFETMTSLDVRNSSGTLGPTEYLSAPLAEPYQAERGGLGTYNLPAPGPQMHARHQCPGGCRDVPRANEVLNFRDGSSLDTERGSQ